MNMKDRFIDLVEPLIIATALSGTVVSYRTLIGDGVFIDAGNAVWSVYFYKNDTMALRSTFGGSSCIRGGITTPEEAAERFIKEFTEFLGR